MPASPEQREHAVHRAGKIFALLKQAAERGERCPPNNLLRERYGVGQSAISGAFNFLETNGMIRVERGQHDRIVTICATGKRTAGAVRQPHWTARAA